MLNKIIEFSIKNKLIIGLFVLGLIGYGIYEVKRLPIDAVPDITNNQVQVITVAPALGATDVERLITFPIEQASSSIPRVEELRSYSSFGLSVITIVFEDDVDVYWARQQITERLQLIQDQLPKGFGSPFLAPVTTGLGEIYQYAVRPLEGYEDQYSAMDLRTIQDWIIRKQLLNVKGVAEVSSFGGLLKQYEIAIHSEKLLAHQLTISEVYDALERNNQNTGGSYIEKGPTALFIRSEGLVSSLSDIENIVIRQLPNGLPVLIGDVATVHFGHATRYGALTYNGEQQISGAIVLMLKGANSNEVITAVKSRIEEIKKTLPEGVTIEPFIDRTKMVNNAISTVTTNLMEGALIVIFVLVLFLGNFRAGLIVASVIPLSMLFAIILMNLFGVSGNLMSLGALDFGLIVDGAVIIVEAVLHRLHSTKTLGGSNLLSQAEMDKEVKSASSRMMNSAVFGQIIILIVYLPIFTLVGIEGKMFKPMAQTVAFALIGAFILSLTYIPMMSSLFLSKKVNQSPTLSDRMMNKLAAFYKGYLVKAIRHQKKIIIGVLLLFIASIYLLTRLGGEFIPALPEGDFAVETRVLPGSNLTTSIDAVSRASKILLTQFPEVERVVTKTGTSEVPSEPLPFDVSDIIIVLKSRKEWTSATSYQELESKMSKALEEVAGVTFSFQYPVAMRFNELISGARQDVVCKIFGENLDTLTHYAQRLGKICASVDGSSGIYVEAVAGLPQITINYNRTLIAQHGLSIEEVNNVVNTAFAGQVAGTVYEGEKRFDLVIRLEQEKRAELVDVQQLLIPTPAGTQIPLSVVADVQITDGPNQIQRENSQRRIIVGFNVRGRDVQSMVEELQSKVEKQMKLPAGYQIQYGGAFENLEAAKERLYVAVPLSLALIFLLLYFAFGSIKQSLLIYTAIPLSAIGGILALVVRDISFSISAGVGFIALFGVAVLNGIVLIAEFNRLRKEGFTNLKRIVIQGTSVRLRPVLMTASVASLGFLPMAISSGEGAEVQRPLATVVIGGLLLATLLTLFVLPILYMLFHKKSTMKNSSAIILLLVGTFLSTSGYAQNNSSTDTTYITLQQAIDTALSRNLQLKSERLKTLYHQQLIKTGIDIPQTNVLGEFGQINSFYSDTRLSASQSINFPTVYRSQKSLVTAEWRQSVLQVGMQESELKMQVAQIYYQLVFLQQKKILLQQMEQMYDGFYTTSKRRFDAGESDVLELATAENLLTKTHFQLVDLLQDEAMMRLQFQLVLNSETNYAPELNDEFAPTKLMIDSVELQQHPYLQFNEQNLKLAEASTALEKAKLAPDIFMAYGIMGMRGLGADDRQYNGALRFQSGQVGLSIPIFSGAQRARIHAAKTNEEIAEMELLQAKKEFENRYKAAIARFQKFDEIVKLYQKRELNNITRIKEVANEQLKQGSINYLDWVLLTNQAIALQSDFLDAVNLRNNAIIELNYYTNF